MADIDKDWLHKQFEELKAKDSAVFEVLEETKSTVAATRETVAQQGEQIKMAIEISHNAHDRADTAHLKADDINKCISGLTTKLLVAVISIGGSLLIGLIVLILTQLFT